MGVEKVLHLNKMAEYSFLEISYDPNVSNTEDVHEALGKLGFILWSPQKWSCRLLDFAYLFVYVKN